MRNQMYVGAPAEQPHRASHLRPAMQSQMLSEIRHASLTMGMARNSLYKYAYVNIKVIWKLIFNLVSCQAESTHSSTMPSTVRVRARVCVCPRMRVCVGAGRRGDPPRLGRALLGHAGVLYMFTAGRDGNVFNVSRSLRNLGKPSGA